MRLATISSHLPRQPWLGPCGSWRAPRRSLPARRLEECCRPAWKALPASDVEEEQQQRMLSAEEEAEWKAAIQQLESLGLAREDAEGSLRKAFGWVHSTYWRKDKVQEAPGSGQVEAVLSFLTDLGLSPSDSLAILGKFPEVLACSVPDRLQGNVAKLEKEWKMKGPAIAGAIKRQPRVLGYSVDCLGDCIGECDRCWVRF